MDDIEKAKSFLNKILSDVSKTSARKQLIIGTSTGWITGYVAMKVGKAAACAIGGGIILFEIANEKGYIKISWDKVNRQIGKVSNPVEEKTVQSPSWMDKVYMFARSNSSLSFGFMGGFFIGVASN